MRTEALEFKTPPQPSSRKYYDLIPPLHKAPFMPINWTMKIQDLLFVGFNSRVVALNKTDGHLVWEWKSPKGSGYSAVYVDGHQLFVSVDGYTYSLDPFTGAERWRNGLKGLGTGVPCLATATGGTGVYSPLGEEYARAQSHSSAAAAT
jgi:outer membrane protein assembly factor BamB